MELKDVKTFDDYEAYVRAKGPEAAAVLDKCERVAHATCVAIDALKEIHMGMYTYDLDEMPVEPEVEFEDDDDEEDEVESLEPETVAAVV